MKRNKGPRKNWFKIQVSIKMFGYSVNFAVPPPQQKKGGQMSFTEMSFFYRGFTWQKFWHTAMTGSATDWEKIIVAISCIYRENVTDENWYSFVLMVRSGKVHVENGGRFQALLPNACFVRVRLCRSIQRLRARRGVIHLARCQGSPRVCKVANSI